MNWLNLGATARLEREQARASLSRLKAFAENWATELPLLDAMVLHTNERRGLRLEDLNRVTALAESYLDAEERGSL